MSTSSQKSIAGADPFSFAYSAATGLGYYFIPQAPALSMPFDYPDSCLMKPTPDD